MNGATPAPCDGDQPPPNPEFVSEDRPLATDLLPHEMASPGYLRRDLSQEEGMRRLNERREAFMARIKGQAGPSYDAAAQKEREDRAAREADVVDAARRSQAEIRRHVDAYLKEHFETIAADIANVLLKQVNERITRGLLAAAETQAITLDRIAGDMRAQLRAFLRTAWSAKGQASKNPSAPRAARKKSARRGQAR
jgi:hypothetical protein